MNKQLKKLWRSVGLGVRWLAQKGLPFSECLLLWLWPKHRFHLALFFFKNSHVKKACNILAGFVPANEIEQLWLERIIGFDEVINSKHCWQISKRQSVPAFNHNVVMVLHNSAPYDFAGYWYRTENILTCQKARGITIQCATRPGYPWDLQKHRGVAATETDWVEGVAFRRLNDRTAPYKQGSDFRYIKNYASQLCKLATQQNATVIHGHSNYLNGLAAVEAARITGIASVYEARGFWHLTRLSKEPAFGKTDVFIYEENM